MTRLLSEVKLRSPRRSLGTQEVVLQLPSLPLLINECEKDWRSEIYVTRNDHPNFSSEQAVIASSLIYLFMNPGLCL